MGYELHIVRNDDWWEEASGGGISFDEWSAFVDQDDSMRMDGFAEAKAPDGSIIRVDQEGLAVWKDYSGNQDLGNQAWFYFFEGSITVKNPDKEILKKILEIAAALGAKVAGDEGEEYNSPGDLDEPNQPRGLDGTKPWWRFW